MTLTDAADALERTIPTEGEARELVGRLHVEMIARCNCNVKSPELQYHNKGCTFRVLGDAASYIERTAQAQGVVREYLEARAEFMVDGPRKKSGRRLGLALDALERLVLPLSYRSDPTPAADLTAALNSKAST
jgi:hypothetical protein